MSAEEDHPTAQSNPRLAAVEEKVSENETVIAWMLSIAKKLGLVNLVVLVGFVGFIAGGTLYAARANAQDMKTISDAGIRAAVPPLAEKLDAHMKAEEEARRQETVAREALDRKFDNSEDRNARRYEVLYNAIIQHAPQPGAEELKQPARVDAGNR